MRNTPMMETIKLSTMATAIRVSESLHDTPKHRGQHLQLQCDNMRSPAGATWRHGTSLEDLKPCRGLVGGKVSLHAADAPD